jgi:hypothetical protein
MSENPKRIFIGGSGRSGTTLLYNCIGKNPDIYILPEHSESRFIIDHDGIHDLVDNLTVKYDVDKANETVRRFRALMTVYLTHQHDAPYFGKDFATWFGSEFYHNRINTFIDELVINKFKGSSLTTHGSKSQGKIIQYAWKLQEIAHRIRFGHGAPIPLPVIFPEQYTVKHFRDRNEILEMCTALIDDIFMHGATEENKKTWCEKTPSNLMHFGFIKELFPDSLFVHILRDPRGTVASMLNVPWAPNNVNDVSIFLKGIYQRWAEMTATLNLEDNFIEIKLEDFVQEPNKILSEIYQKAGVHAMHSDLPPMSLDRISGWKKKFSESELKIANDILNEEIALFGYEL